MIRDGRELGWDGVRIEVMRVRLYDDGCVLDDEGISGSLQLSGAMFYFILRSLSVGFEFRNDE